MTGSCYYLRYKPQNKTCIVTWWTEFQVLCFGQHKQTKMASGIDINRPDINLFIVFCIPVSMQRAANRSVTWVIWSGDSSMWTQPTFPSNSNWWTQKTDGKKHDKTPKRKQNMQNVLGRSNTCCSVQLCFSYVNRLFSNLWKSNTQQ